MYYSMRIDLVECDQIQCTYIVIVQSINERYAVKYDLLTHIYTVAKMMTKRQQAHNEMKAVELYRKNRFAFFLIAWVMCTYTQMKTNTVNLQFTSGRWVGKNIKSVNLPLCLLADAKSARYCALPLLITWFLYTFFWINKHSEWQMYFHISSYTWPLHAQLFAKNIFLRKHKGFQLFNVPSFRSQNRKHSWISRVIADFICFQFLLFLLNVS